jgi:hypothetical protein
LTHKYRDVFMNFLDVTNFPSPHKMSFTHIVVVLGALCLVAEELRDPWRDIRQSCNASFRLVDFSLAGAVPGVVGSEAYSRVLISP